MMLRAAAVASLMVAGLTIAVATGWGALALFYLAIFDSARNMLPATLPTHLT